MKYSIFFVGCLAILALGCSESFEKDTMRIAEILRDAYSLEQAGPSKEGVAEDGKTKIIIMSTDISKSKEYLEKKRKDLNSLYKRINSHSIARTKENYFNSLFVDLIVNLDFYHLTGSYFNDNFDFQKMTSELDLTNLSNWVLDKFYSERMPKFLKEDWSGKDHSQKIDEVNKYINFSIKRQPIEKP